MMGIKMNTLYGHPITHLTLLANVVCDSLYHYILALHLNVLSAYQVSISSFVQVSLGYGLPLQVIVTIICWTNTEHYVLNRKTFVTLKTDFMVWVLNNDIVIRSLLLILQCYICNFPPSLYVFIIPITWVIWSEFTTILSQSGATPTDLRDGLWEQEGRATRRTL